MSRRIHVIIQKPVQSVCHLISVIEVKLNLCTEFVQINPLLLLNNIGNEIPSNDFLIDVCSLVLRISARNWFLSEWKPPRERPVQTEVEEEGSITLMTIH